MTRYVRIGVLGVLGLSACGRRSLQSDGGPPVGGTGGQGQGTTGSAGASGGAGLNGPDGAVWTGVAGAAGASDGGGGGGAGGDIACVPGIPATTQLRRMRNREYDAAVRDLLGVTTVAVTGSAASQPSALLYADYEGAMVPDAWRLYQDVGAAIAKAVMANPTQKAKFISCDPAAAGCLTATIKSFGRKAYRRPLTDAELMRFTALGEGSASGTPDEVAEAALFAFLVSPPFLMVPEMSTTPAASGQSRFQLSSYEVAARLSFMIWGSVPDDVLNAAADANQVQTAAQILAQAQRMISMREKSAPQVSAFHRFWAQMDSNGSTHWWSGDHDVTKFPLYSSAARASYAAELDNFFAEIAFTNGSYKDLLLSNVAFVNKDNAAIYGLSNPGTALTKVQLDPVQRPGFMTRVGFLSSYSHYDQTAPMLRGSYIITYMLGLNVGPPPPTPVMVTPPSGAYTTNRERTEALVNQASACMGCHDFINPPGYVLENYDAIGVWQTIDKLGNGPIDPVANVNFGDGNIKKIHNAQELMQEIARSRRGQQLYAQSMVTFGYGRAPNPNDRCLVDAISAKLANDGYAILDLLADLTQTDSFRLRVRAVP